MTLQELANQHRAAILANDAQLADQIAAQYRKAFARLYKKLQLLLQQMQQAEQDALDNDQPFNAHVWILQFNRLDGLLFSVKQDFGSFANQASQMVQGQLRSAWASGQDNALALLDHQLGQVKGVFGVPNPDAIDTLINRGFSHQVVADLFNKMDRQTVDLVRKRLIAGVSLGENPRQIAADLAQALKMPLNRALVIARTESINAYRSAALDTYRANSDVVEKWIWSAAAGACPFCQSMDGTEHDLSEDMSSHPQCRCAALPKTVSYDQILDQLAS